MTEQHSIPMNEVTDDFAKCWQSAGRHIQSQVDDGCLNFFRANFPHGTESVIDFRAQKTNSRYLHSVAVGNANEAFDPAGGGMPLWRGHGLMVGFEDLIDLNTTRLN